MTMYRKILLTSVLLVVGATSLYSQPYYVSTTGNDLNPGTIDSAFQTITKAMSMAVAGDTIYLRGGVHNYAVKISVSKSGSAGLPIRLWAYPGEKPIIDFSGIGGTSSDGFSFSGRNYWHFKGLEIRKAPHCAVKISNGDYNIFENCSFHDCGNTGFNIGSSSAGAPYPSNNLVLNCDAYFNYDPPIGGNADGFAAKWNVGSGNVFRGCRSWNNSDDGYDLWMCKGVITLDSCFAFRNGVDSWHSGSFNGNGNGFKLGGNNVATPTIVRNCVSFDNAIVGISGAGRGFDENNNLAGQTLFNCTAYRNMGDNYHFTNTVTMGSHLIENCISYQGIVNITSGTVDYNSWNGLTVTEADFVSLDTAQAVAPRNADGSLPEMTFFHLAQGSSMIDAGKDVGLPYKGLAPDLGAYESDYSTDVADEAHIRIADFRLFQNFPNPFNPVTTIRFQVPTTARVKLEVFNILGQHIATLIDGERMAGDYQVPFDAKGLSSGVYFYKLSAGSFVKISKMLLVR